MSLVAVTQRGTKAMARLVGTQRERKSGRWWSLAGCVEEVRQPIKDNVAVQLVGEDVQMQRRREGTVEGAAQGVLRAAEDVGVKLREERFQ